MYHVDMMREKSHLPPSNRPAARALTAQVTDSQKAKPFQVLLRLPEDMASRFVQIVKPGQRNSYFLELLRRDLDRESNELAQAAKALTQLESKDSTLQNEDAIWLDAPLLDNDDAFDAALFERQYQAASKASL
jgi:hypothetical protein